MLTASSSNACTSSIMGLKLCAAGVEDDLFLDPLAVPEPAPPFPGALVALPDDPVSVVDTVEFKDCPSSMALALERIKAHFFRDSNLSLFATLDGLLYPAAGTAAVTSLSALRSSGFGPVLVISAAGSDATTC